MFPRLYESCGQVRVAEQNLGDRVEFPGSEREHDSLLQTARILSLILPVKVSLQIAPPKEQRS